MNRTIRDALADPPTLLLVDPDGAIRTATVALGVNHPLVDRAGCLRPHLRAAGWATLEEMYEADPLGAKGWTTYLDFAAARHAGRPGELPDAWLPREVRERRARAAESIEWTAPPLPDDAAPKTRRKRARA